MAVGRKTGGADFKPGNTTGKGRPTLPEDLKGVKELTKEYLTRLISMFLDKPISEIEKIAEDSTAPAKYALVAGIIVKALKFGDHTRLEFLLGRTIGKVTEKVELSGKPYMAIHRTDGSKVVLTTTDKIEGDEE
jgi:hypothetical protein